MCATCGCGKGEVRIEGTAAAHGHDHAHEHDHHHDTITAMSTLMTPRSTMSMRTGSPASSRSSRIS